MTAQVKVTAQDLESGESESVEISNNYVLTTAGTAYVASTVAHANGTHVITVKGCKP